MSGAESVALTEASAEQSRQMRIAYIGPGYNTSLHRARAMQRLGHSVSIIDPGQFLPKSKWMFRWLHHTGGIGVGLKIDRPIVEAVGQTRPDLIWVDQGATLGGDLIRKLRSFGVPIVNYTIDDPFGGRDGRRFNRYLTALPFYDLLAVVREENVAEAYARGARRVIRVWRSADEVEHRPRELTAEDRVRWGSEVCFAGAWFPERGQFMVDLIQSGVPLSIWGNSWDKAPEWRMIAPYWRGPGQLDPEVYCRIIQAAKICIGLVSKGNRDRHTTRSLEIPAVGGLLCAERTDEHMLLYKENHEVMLWSTAKECADVCLTLLRDQEKIERIKANALVRSKVNGNFNERVISKVLSEIKS